MDRNVAYLPKVQVEKDFPTDDYLMSIVVP